MISGFDSVKDYGRFVIAREFWEKGPPLRLFPKKASLFERVANACTQPLLGGFDVVLRNFRRPGVVTALTMSSIAMLTFLIYPDKCAGWVSRWIPGLTLEPWMIKAGSYIGSQATIAALGARTLARLNDRELMTAWKEKRIISVSPGTVIERGVV